MCHNDQLKGSHFNEVTFFNNYINFPECYLVLELLSYLLGHTIMYIYIRVWNFTLYIKVFFTLIP